MIGTGLLDPAETTNGKDQYDEKRNNLQCVLWMVTHGCLWECPGDPHGNNCLAACSSDAFAGTAAGCFDGGTTLVESGWSGATGDDLAACFSTGDGIDALDVAGADDASGLCGDGSRDDGLAAGDAAGDAGGGHGNAADGSVAGDVACRDSSGSVS